MILMFVGKYLLIPVVSGFAHPLWGYKSDVSFLAVEASKGKRRMVGATVFFALLIVAYLVLLLRFWNLGVVAAAVMLMLARLPDEFRELRTGERIAPGNLPQGGLLNNVIPGVIWLALPVLWVSLCWGGD